MHSLFPKTIGAKQGQTLHIDVATPEDAEEIIDYTNRVGGESDFLTFGKDEFWATPDGERAFIRAMQENPKSLMLKGSIHGKIVSILTLNATDRPRIAHVAEMGISVSADHWRSGVGRLMCVASIEWAKYAGLRKINLRVREDNLRAIAMYEGLSFIHEGISQRAYLVNGRYYADRLMGLALD